MFDFHQLKVFVTVAGERSFSKAAEKVYLSQSTVSTHIHKLEKELGVRLFDRTKKEVILTFTGRKLYSWAQEILAMRERAIIDIRQQAVNYKGNIKVFASTVPAQYILPDFIGEFVKKFPLASFNVLQESSEKVFEALLNGEGEVGFMGAEFECKKINYVPIADDEIVLILPGKAESDCSEMKLEDVLRLDILLRSPGSGTQKIFESELVKRGLSLKDLKVKARFDSTEAVKQAVKIGLGAAFVSETAVRDYRENGYVKVIDVKELNLKREFYLAYNIEKTSSPVCEKFIEFCREYNMVQ